MADPLNPGLAVGADLAKVYGEDSRCPICGAFAKTTPHPEHQWVCDVCGAPRVVISWSGAGAPMAGEKVPEETAVALREASMAQRNAALERVKSWGMGAPAAMTLLLAVLLAPASFVVSGVLIGIGVLLAVMSARASRRAATERKRVRSAVERAWESAILHLAGENKTPTEIATALRIAEGEVEATLATRLPVRIAQERRIAVPEETPPEEEPALEAEKRS